MNGVWNLVRGKAIFVFITPDRDDDHHFRECQDRHDSDNRRRITCCMWIEDERDEEKQPIKQHKARGKMRNF